MSLAHSAVVGLINLDRATERLVFLKQFPDLREHAPCRLVRDASFALDLLCGNAATGRSHQVYGVEPELQGRGRFMEDRSSRRVFVMAAIIARVRWTASIAMMPRHLVANLAMNALRVQIPPQPIEASGIVGEHGVEVHDGELLLFGLNVVPKLLVAHIPILPQVVPTVKGYLP